MRQNRRILVLGVGRSGTTFLTQYLRLSGVFVGNEVWRYEEHPEMRRINEDFLEQRFGADAKRRPYGILPRGRIECGPVWHERAQALVKRMDQQSVRAGSSDWALKDPRSTVLHTLWAPYADVVVGIFRSPDQVVASYLRMRWIRGWRKTALARRYWIRFNQALLDVHATMTEKEIYIINYNGDVPGQCEALCRRLGIEPSQAARALFDPSRSHHYASSRKVDSQCRRIYTDLLKTALVPEAKT